MQYSPELPASTSQLEALLVTIPQACKLIGLSRSKIYAEMKAGRLTYRKCGKRTLFLVEGPFSDVSGLVHDPARVVVGLAGVHTARGAVVEAEFELALQDGRELVTGMRVAPGSRARGEFAPRHHDLLRLVVARRRAQENLDGEPRGLGAGVAHHRGKAAVGQEQRHRAERSHDRDASEESEEAASHRDSLPRHAR